MGSVDAAFASALQARLGLRRAVETGTYLGSTARKLARIFPDVVTIELSAELHARAVEALKDLPNVTAVAGHSVDRLGELADGVPTLYFLDGHWSAGATSGESDECPVLRELAVIGAGHPDDCLVIDDARMFASAPPPPLDPRQWPPLVEVLDAIRALRPQHIVTVVDDQVIAVPESARQALDEYGWRLQHMSFPEAKLRGLAGLARARLDRLVDARRP